MPEREAPGTTRAIAELAQNSLRKSHVRSSSRAAHSGWSLGNGGRAMARKTRASALLGPEPMRSRRGGSSLPIDVSLARSVAQNVLVHTPLVKRFERARGWYSSDAIHQQQLRSDSIEALVEPTATVGEHSVEGKVPKG